MASLNSLPIGRRSHRANWQWQSDIVANAILRAIQDPKTIPPDIAKLAEAWTKLETLRSDLRLQPKPTRVPVPLPRSLAAELQAQAQGFPGALKPAAGSSLPSFTLPTPIESPTPPSQLNTTAPAEHLSDSNGEAAA